MPKAHPTKLLNRPEVAALIERLDFTSLTELNAATVDAEGDAEYTVLASQWFRKRLDEGQTEDAA